MLSSARVKESWPILDPASPAMAGFPLRSNPDESESPLCSDKLDAGNALAIAVQAND